MVLVELGDGGLEGEFAAGDLEALDEVGGAGEEHAPSVLDEAEADGGGEVAFPGAGGAEDEQVVALLEPAVAGDERHDLGPGEPGDGIEVEGVEGLAGRQARLGEVAGDAPPGAFGELVLGEGGEGGEEAGGGPALLVGALGEARPEVSDRRQAQVAEQQAEAGGVDRIGGVHGRGVVGHVASPPASPLEVEAVSAS